MSWLPSDAEGHQSRAVPAEDVAYVVGVETMGSDASRRHPSANTLSVSNRARSAWSSRS
jgi:hypothetical protein